MKIVDKTSDTAWSEYRLHEDGGVDIQHFENVDVILKECAYLRSLPDSMKSKEGNRLQAKLPPTLAAELDRKGILHDKERFRRWLNDRDNCKWRTSTGRI